MAYCPNDGYFFEHLVYHMSQAGRHEEIYTLLTEKAEWMNVKFVVTQGDASYGDDLRIALTNFNCSTPQQLLNLVRLVIAHTGLQERVTTYSDEILLTMALLGSGKVAANYARLRSSPRKRCQALYGLHHVVKGRNEDDLASTILSEAEELFKTLNTADRELLTREIDQLVRKIESPELPSTDERLSPEAIRLLREQHMLDLLTDSLHNLLEMTLADMPAEEVLEMVEGFLTKSATAGGLLFMAEHFAKTNDPRASEFAMKAAQVGRTSSIPYSRIEALMQSAKLLESLSNPLAEVIKEQANVEIHNAMDFLWQHAGDGLLRPDPLQVRIFLYLALKFLELGWEDRAIELLNVYGIHLFFHLGLKSSERGDQDLLRSFALGYASKGYIRVACQFAMKVAYPSLRKAGEILREIAFIAVKLNQLDDALHTLTAMIWDNYDRLPAAENIALYLASSGHPRAAEFLDVWIYYEDAGLSDATLATQLQELIGVLLCQGRISESLAILSQMPVELDSYGWTYSLLPEVLTAILKAIASSKEELRDAHFEQVLMVVERIHNNYFRTAALTAVAEHMAMVSNRRYREMLHRARECASRVDGKVQRLRLLVRIAREFALQRAQDAMEIAENVLPDISSLNETEEPVEGMCSIVEIFAVFDKTRAITEIENVINYAMQHHLKDEDWVPCLAQQLAEMEQFEKAISLAHMLKTGSNAVVTRLQVANLVWKNHAASAGELFDGATELIETGLDGRLERTNSEPSVTKIYLDIADMLPLKDVASAYARSGNSDKMMELLRRILSIGSSLVGIKLSLAIAEGLAAGGSTDALDAHSQVRTAVMLVVNENDRQEAERLVQARYSSIASYLGKAGYIDLGIELMTQVSSSKIRLQIAETLIRQCVQNAVVCPKALLDQWKRLLDGNGDVLHRFRSLTRSGQYSEAFRMIASVVDSDARFECVVELSREMISAGVQLPMRDFIATGFDTTTYLRWIGEWLLSRSAKGMTDLMVDFVGWYSAFASIKDHFFETALLEMMRIAGWISPTWRNINTTQRHLEEISS